jgi:hypothetical protein
MLRMEHDLCKEQIQTTIPPASDEAVCYHLSGDDPEPRQDSAPPVRGIGCWRVLVLQ